MGWVILERTQRRLIKTQKALFDNGAKSGNKITAEKTEKRMRKQFEAKDYLQVTTIKSYFSRRAAKNKKGEIMEDDVL